MSGLVIDLFAGGGGASTGLEAALGRPVDIALNHDAIALAAHKRNHPQTLHLEADIWKVRPLDATNGRPVDVLWASPDCTHHSKAKSGKPRSQKLRSLAWSVVRWAAATKPRIIFLENVEEFEDWGPLDQDGQPDKKRKGESFQRWVRKLRALGYDVEWRTLVACDYGAPTSRKRLFLVARRDGEPIRWPERTHGPGRAPYHTAAECMDWSIRCPSIFERRRPLAEKTIWRIARGIQKFIIDNPRPFIVPADRLVAPTLIQTGYGERPGQKPRCLDLHEPLGAVVAGGSKHALVSAFLARHFGGMVGQQFELPLPTVTARDHHSAVTATLVKMRGDCSGVPIDQPLPTVSAQGTHLAEVRAFLVAYYATNIGQSLFDPMRTITTRHRLGLVMVHGEPFQIVDIGLRMLRSHELLAAQFGRFAAGCDLSPAKTESGKIKLIGNSVSPENAEAVIAANFRDAERRAA